MAYKIGDKVLIEATIVAPANMAGDIKAMVTFADGTEDTCWTSEEITRPWTEPATEWNCSKGLHKCGACGELKVDEIDVGP